MYRCFVSDNGKIVECNEICENSLITIIEPTEEELESFSSKLGIAKNKLSAVTDTEEASNIDTDDDGTYIIVDVPYLNEQSNYETIPLSIILRNNLIVAVCEKNTGLVKRFLDQTSKGLNLGDRMDFIVRFLYAVSKEYQQDLREIDRKRRAVESRIHNKSSDEDIILLHDLENSLVYFITSLKGCNMLLEVMKRNTTDKMEKRTKELFKTVIVENRQAIEMATIYKEILNSTRDLLGTEINIKLNDTMKTLTAITIILTIPMIITGAYGMNVKLPLENESWAFPCILIGMFAVCVIIWMLLWKRKIL